jgi:hypothetical protein
VEGGDMEQEGVVPELAQPAIALEAQKGTDCPRVVVVIDVLGRRRPADCTEPALRLQQGVCLFSSDAVPACQVVSAAATSFGDVLLPTLVVARQTIGGKTG